jgi:ParB family chromosome partitioning protein
VERQRELAGEIIERGLSVRETEEAVKTGGSAAKVARRSTATQNDANIRAAELRMKRLLGAPVRIQFGRKGGKIVISFGSASDLDRIYSLILRKPETAASPETAL